jgi:rubrerythrin
MPEFSNPFGGIALNRNLTHEELVRAIRFNIAAEFEAIQMYMQLAESTDNDKAKAVLVDVANEEREHVGEFMHLLQELSPDEQRFYQKGKAEVVELIKKMR